MYAWSNQSLDCILDGGAPVALRVYQSAIHFHVVFAINEKTWPMQDVCEKLTLLQEDTKAIPTVFPQGPHDG